MVQPELRTKLAELNQQKAVAERELAILQDGRRRLDQLDALPNLIEEYIRDFPYLIERPNSRVGERGRAQRFRGHTTCWV